MKIHDFPLQSGSNNNSVSSENTTLISSILFGNLLTANCNFEGYIQLDYLNTHIFNNLEEHPLQLALRDNIYDNTPTKRTDSSIPEIKKY